VNAGLTGKRISTVLAYRQTRAGLAEPR